MTSVTPSRYPIGIPSNCNGRSAGGGLLLSCFLVEEEGCKAVGGFQNFLNFSLLTFSSSSAAFLATFQSGLLTIFICFGVNTLLVAEVLLHLVDVGEMNQPMIQSVTIHS